jgi:hypothetical protein
MRALSYAAYGTSDQIIFSAGFGTIALTLNLPALSKGGVTIDGTAGTGGFVVLEPAPQTLRPVTISREVLRIGSW